MLASSAKAEIGAGAGVPTGTLNGIVRGIDTALDAIIFNTRGLRPILNRSGLGLAPCRTDTLILKFFVKPSGVVITADLWER
jgi:hypothetical protein